MIREATTLTIAFGISVCFAEEPMTPMMVKLGEPILIETFEKDGQSYDHWPSTNKRWSPKDGVLRGLPSTKEYREQQGRSHNGTAPNLFIRFGGLEKPVPNVCFAIRFKYLSSEEVNVPDDLEPIGRVGFAGKSTLLWIEAADSRIGTLRYTYGADKTMRLEFDRWYECLFEVFQDEVVVQVKDGPTFYGKDQNISLKGTEEKTNRVFISGPKESTVVIDHVKVWAAPGLKNTWAEARQPLLAAYAPKQIEKKRKTQKGPCSQTVKSAQNQHHCPIQFMLVPESGPFAASPFGLFRR